MENRQLDLFGGDRGAGVRGTMTWRRVLFLLLLGVLIGLVIFFRH